MEDQKVDFHMHSCFSDGALTPEELVDRYVRNGYQQIAITDHDGVQGSKLAIRYAKEKSIRVIPGIELSTKDDDRNTIHVLGYYIDLDDESLNDAIRQFLLWRSQRNDRILAIMREEGYPLTLDDLMLVNGGYFIGKPTFVEALYLTGMVSSREAATQVVFDNPEIKTLRKKVFRTEEAIQLIHGAGGMAVLAHPMEIRKSGENLNCFYSRFDGILSQLIAQGIDGMECYHPSASEAQSMHLLSIAKEKHLVITRGSDFHSDTTRRVYEN